jgi:hypothetical protein
MRRMKRTAGLATLVLLVALLAPRLAMAHANEHHGAASGQSESPASAPHARPGTAAVGAPSCPADHGGVCSCGGDLASPAKPAALIAPYTAFAIVPVSAVGMPLERTMPRAPPQAFSLQLPRAPPSFS